MALMNYAQAACQALAEAMRADPRVSRWARTWDAAAYSASTAAYSRRSARRGSSTHRSRRRPSWRGGGMALTGLRPVVEMRVVDFALCAIDEIVNQAAKNRYMFGGQGRVPLVARLPIGIWSGSAAQHSQSLEAGSLTFRPVVVARRRRPTTTPCSPRPSIAAIRSYTWNTKNCGARRRGAAAAHGCLGQSAPGASRTDLTLVTWSKLVHTALAAAEQAAQQGVSVEVIDLRSIWPGTATW